MATKKTQQSIENRESLIAKLNQELLKLELQFEIDVLEKFNDIIIDSKLTPEICADLINENRNDLGSTDYDRFYVEIIDNLFNRAKGQHENDIDNGDDIGFYFALSTCVDRIQSEKLDELSDLKKSGKK